MDLFAASGQARTFDFRASDVRFVPFAMGHYVENTRAMPMRFLEIFNSNYFADVSLDLDGFDAAGACGGAFEIRSAGNGRTAQDQSARRAGVDSDRGRTGPR
jgi:hypothetical protein